MKQKLSDYVMSRVAQEAKHVFFLPGGGSMHLVDSLGRQEGLTPVCCLHEQACAVAAEAHAQASGGLGVCLVTTGPGGTNALTGVAAAWCDSTPLLVISGQVKTADIKGLSGLRQKGFQEIDITGMVGPITKSAATVYDPRNIRAMLEHAINTAKSGRPGPVWLDIPLDVQAAEIDFNDLELSDEPQKVTYQLGKVDQVVELLRKAERPVLLLGNGMRRSMSLLPQLLDALPIPVLLTWRAVDFLDEDHPLYCGRPGAVGQRGANFALQNADMLIAVGARCDPGQTGYNSEHFAFQAMRVIVDIDPYEAAKLSTVNRVPVECKIVTDAGDFLQELLKQWDVPKISFDRRPWYGWFTQCRRWKEKYPITSPGTAEDGVCPYALVDALSRAMLPTDILVPGSSGQCSEAVLQAFRVKVGQRVLNSPGLGAMGFGVPAAIGACLATGRRTVCVEGDGGFCMNAQELATVARLDLPIKFFVLNNDGYQSIRETQRRHFGGRLVGSSPESGCELPSIKYMAKAAGIDYHHIDYQEHVDDVKFLLENEGPAVIEVMTADVQTQPRCVSEMREGRLVTSLLEDLWPFLPRDEFEENMR